MNGNRFAQQVQAAHQRAQELHRRVSEPLRQETELLTNSLEELHTTLEELVVAEMELNQQNEELAAARQVVEVERQRYQDLFEFAPDGYLLTSIDGTIQEANRAAAILLNIRQQSLMGKPLITFIPQEGRRVFRSELIQLHQLNRSEWEARLQPRSSKGKARPCFDAALTTVTVHDQDGKSVALRWLLRDVTIRKRAEAELHRHAFYDPLTGLANRALFMNRLQHALAYAKRYEDYLFAVLFLDLDRFKVINDSLGHTLGDQLLITVAGKLQACLRPTDTVSRLGGDEFTVLLEGINHVSDVIRVVERIQAELRLPLSLRGQEVLTTASIGIALGATDYDQPEDMLRDADIAMYQAKAQGLGHYKVFNPDMHTRIIVRLQMEMELRRAIEHREFRVHYQPIVSLETGRVTGFEALIRWQHPDRGLILPEEFIPVATEIGLSFLIDQWVLRQACRQTRQWQGKFPNNPPLTISVNFCNHHFWHPELIQEISQTLQETGLDAHSLKLEITESVMMEDAQSTNTLLSQLQALNVELYVDDFGTGYSSLSRLHYFPICMLKIDRSFVSRMGIDEKSDAKAANILIVEAIVTLAHKLGLAVTAEGVETAEQLTQLKKLNCNYGQGYLFSQPLDAEAAEALIVASPHWQGALMYPSPTCN